MSLVLATFHLSKTAPWFLYKILWKHACICNLREQIERIYANLWVGTCVFLSRMGMKTSRYWTLTQPIGVFMRFLVEPQFDCSGMLVDHIRSPSISRVSKCRDEAPEMKYPVCLLALFQIIFRQPHVSWHFSGRSETSSSARATSGNRTCRSPRRMRSFGHWNWFN